MMSKVVIEYNEHMGYPSHLYNYNPSIIYPEYKFDKKNISIEDNSVYHMVRNSLYHMGLDKDRFGTEEWNPLGKYITPGMRVLIKPNWVLHFNGNKNIHKYAMECLVTHPSCLRAICDYCLIALDGKGSILIADAPMQDCNLELLLESLHYNEILKFYQELNQPVTFMDLRKYRSVFNKNMVITEKIMLNGEGIDVDVSNCSFHEKRDGARVYQVDNYDNDETAAFHKDSKHIYSINREVLESDFIINFSKPKSHRLAGFTAAMKNIVGISYDKASLPHRTANSIKEGGDAYPEKNIIKKKIDAVLNDKTKAEKKGNIIRATIDRFVYGGLLIFERKLGNPYIKGIWYGNDTIWRTIVDLNYIVRYADKNGVINKTQQRKVLNFGDMIIAGDHNGPCQPDPKPMGVLMASEDVRAFDIGFCKLAGFDNEQILMYKGITSSDLDQIFGKLHLPEFILNGIEVDMNHQWPKEWRYQMHDMWKYIR